MKNSKRISGSGESSSMDKAMIGIMEKVFHDIDKLRLDSLYTDSGSISDMLYSLYLEYSSGDKKKWATCGTGGRMRKITPFLPRSANRYVDVGSGDCSMTDKISDAVSAAETYAIDVKDYHCQSSQTIPMVVPEGENIQLSQIDLVTCLYTLHHMRDVSLKLQNISDMVRKGGILIVQDHDVRNPEDEKIVVFEHICYTVQELDAGISKDRFDQIVDAYKDYEYYDYRSFRSWDKTIRSLGFERKKYTQYDTYNRSFIVKYIRL